MAHPARRVIAKAAAALSAFQTATDLDDAEDAWCDFLHYWVRAVNKYDSHGRSEFGDKWVAMKSELRSDDRLLFLWEARNTDEHSVEPVALKSDPKSVLTPVYIDVGDGITLSPGGHVGVDLGGLAMSFVPGSLHLVELRSGRERYPPPLDNGLPITPHSLMGYGLEFLARAIPE